MNSSNLAYAIEGSASSGPDIAADTRNMQKQQIAPLALILAAAFTIPRPAAFSANPRQTAGNSYESSASPSTMDQFFVASVDAEKGTAVVVDQSNRRSTSLQQNARLGDWTLMAVLPELQGGVAVLENLTTTKGEILYLGKRGVLLRLSETAEATTAPANTLYAGHTLDEIIKSKPDILSPLLLEGKDDPSYDKVAAVLPPLRVPTFVGTPHGDDKPTFEYGGFSDEIYLDPGKLYPAIREARSKQNVREGLIGGWLPSRPIRIPVGKSILLGGVDLCRCGAGKFLDPANLVPGPFRSRRRPQRGSLLQSASSFSSTWRTTRFVFL